MALIVLTKSADGVPPEEIVLRGEAIEQLHWEECSATHCSVAVRNASGDPVLIFSGSRAAASTIHTKIKAGM